MNDDRKPANDMPSPIPTPPRGERPGAPDAQPGEAPGAPEHPGEISAAQMKEVIAALQAELEKKTAEISDRHDQFLRAHAETENVRRRLEKEKEDTARYAISKFAKDIISVGDNFQRAIDAVPQEAVDADPALRNLVDGVVLAEREFVQVLSRNGVSAIDPTGKAFNPHHHQAVMEEDRADVPTGTVLKVFQTGYLIDDRCLRPAMVVVSRGGAKTPKSERPAASETTGSAPQDPDSDPAPDTNDT